MRRLAWKLHGPGVPGSGDFWDSRLAREPLIFAQNLSFWSAGREFRVGQVCRTSAKQKHCEYVRIQRLEYGRGDWLNVDREKKMPPLQVVVSRFIPANSLSGSLSLKRSTRSGELVHWNLDFSVLSPADFLEVVQMPLSSRSGGAHCSTEAIFQPCKQPIVFCPFRPVAPLYTFRAIADGLPFVWLELFVDGTTVRSSRPRSSVAVYLRFAGMPNRHNSRCENIFPIMWIPPGVDQYEVISMNCLFV